MRRIVLWLLSTVTVVALLFGYHTSTAGALKTTTSALAPVTGGSSGTGTGSGDTSSGSGSGRGSGNGSGNGSGSGSGGNGSAPTDPVTVDGGVAQTQWGPVQVQLVIENSSITDVNILQYPHGNGQDIQINNYALPILIQETVDSQGQQVDMISGATVTSVGYLQSLQSALDQANL